MFDVRLTSLKADRLRKHLHVFAAIVYGTLRIDANLTEGMRCVSSAAMRQVMIRPNRTVCADSAELV